MRRQVPPVRGRCGVNGPAVLALCAIGAALIVGVMAALDALADRRDDWDETEQWTRARRATSDQRRADLARGQERDER